MTRTSLRRMAIVGALALAATACGNIAERVTEGVLERAAGGDVDIDFDEDGEGSITVETSEGTARFGAGGNLPDAFPDDLPLPDADYRVAQSFEQSNNDEMAFQVSLAVQAYYEDILDQLEADLEGAGWEITDRNSMTGEDFANVTLLVQKGDLRVVVTVLSDGSEDESIVSYTLTVESS